MGKEPNYCDLSLHITHFCINRCSDRLHSGIGRCNLPYETLSEDRELLNTAYTIYQKIQDCNVAYNDTLDCVIDRIEEMIGEVQ